MVCYGKSPRGSCSGSLSSRAAVLKVDISEEQPHGMKLGYV